LAWPIDNKMDIGRLPRSRREPTPSDDVVREWAEAVAREKDPYLRLIWLFIAQHGWRPSHATGIRWGDIQYDSTGQPYAIVSRGARGEFKTFAPVAARLSHDVIQALQEWKKVHPEPYSDTWVLPWRSAKGIIRVYQRINKYVFHANWKRLRKKYSLPPLRPKDMRHWVATTCRKAGLSKIATAYLQGHDATEGGAMRDWYDNPRLEEIFEEQENCLPNGPLGTLLISNVEVMPGIPNEAISLLQRYITGKIGTLDFVSLIEEIRAKCLQRLSV
ncbi:MAG: site-specific integrase, partial [Thermoplasmata archaeon]